MDEKLSKIFHMLRPLVVVYGKIGSGKTYAIKKFLEKHNYSYTEYNNTFEDFEDFLKSLENVGIEIFFGTKKRAIIIKNYDKIMTKQQSQDFFSYKSDVRNIPVFLTTSINKEINNIYCVKMEYYTEKQLFDILKKEFKISKNIITNVIKSSNQDISHMKETLLLLSKNNNKTIDGIEFKQETNILNKLYSFKDLSFKHKLLYSNLGMNNIIYENYIKLSDDINKLADISDRLSINDNLYNKLNNDNMWETEMLEEYYANGILYPIYKLDNKLENLKLTRCTVSNKNIKFNLYNDVKYIDKYISKDISRYSNFLLNYYYIEEKDIKNLIKNINKKNKKEIEEYIEEEYEQEIE